MRANYKQENWNPGHVSRVLRNSRTLEEMNGPKEYIYTWEHTGVYVHQHRGGGGISLVYKMSA